VCGGPAEAHCARCRAVAYCGPKCQRAAWPAHKIACAAAVAAASSGTPVSAPAGVSGAAAGADSCSSGARGPAPSTAPGDDDDAAATDRATVLGMPVALVRAAMARASGHAHVGAGVCDEHAGCCGSHDPLELLDELISGTYAGGMHHLCGLFECADARTRGELLRRGAAGALLGTLRAGARAHDASGLVFSLGSWSTGDMRRGAVRTGECVSEALSAALHALRAYYGDLEVTMVSLGGRGRVRGRCR
jgi:hypothetical protein